MADSDRTSRIYSVGIMSDWSPGSWRARPALQQPEYPDKSHLQEILAQLAALPPLVVSWEIEDLKHRLAAAQQGEAFMLQGGNCAETFDDCDSDRITSQLKILLQMSLVLVQGLKRPVIRVGRIAGQYAKPRSADTETRDGLTLPAFRGDNVNRSEFTAEARTPDPRLLLRGYKRSALTLNFARALVEGGFADLHHPEYWDLGFVAHSPLEAKYRAIAGSIADALDFFEGMTGRPMNESNRATYFVSHEGLHLECETALTRFVAHRGSWYNLSTHLPWIGLRTADPDGAHVEYFRGIANPIGVKIGPSMDPDWIKRLVEVLNPADEPGRLVLIARFGAAGVEKHLPLAVEAVRATGKSVLWVTDPMHGNTEVTGGGIKTRRFDNILAETERSFEIHAGLGSRLGGVHVEITGDNVTECTGGARGLADSDLQRAYLSTVDPRLNYEQALELSLLVAEHARRQSP